MTSDRATLTWGVKQSFRAYVESAGGVIEVGAGATRAEDGGFSFAAAPGDGLKLGSDGRPEGTGGFVGEVRFEAHGGMLKVFLADPAIEVGPAGASITVADSAARDRRVEFALLDLAAATRDGDALVIPAKLSRDGWRVLGDHYAPMTALDPVRLTLG
jgi:hypothetical protein